VLKTGCEIEERQLQTWERMEVLLSMYSVIAWKVLELRELARGEHGCSPEVLLSEAERTVLETIVIHVWENLLPERSQPGSLILSPGQSITVSHHRNQLTANRLPLHHRQAGDT
jgi:hypothetical protein